MGCFGSRVAIFRSCSFPAGRRNSRRQNIFAVQNVDDLGQGVSPGKLEVTETDLVLHVKGKPSLTWPLRCLRRYGFDNDLFSFESGRRCPTGAGIFAFRCHRAQSLFNLLQAKIQGNPASLPTVPSTPITPPTAGTPINSANNPPTTPVSSTFVYVNLSESNSSRFLSSSVAAGVTGGDPPDVVQTPGGSLPHADEPPAGVPARIPLKPVEQNHPVYMNVESHGGALYSASATNSSANYQNNLISIPRAPRNTTTTVLNGGRNDQTAAAAAAGPSSLSASLLGPVQSQDALYSNVFCSKGSVPLWNSAHPPFFHEPAEINYAELDLKTDRPSSSSNSPYSGRLGLLKHHHQLLSSSQSAPQGAASDPLAASRLRLASCGGSGGDAAAPTRATDVHVKLTNNQNNGDLGYATIDFDKTAALSVITRSKINLGFNSNDNESGSSSVSKKSRHNSTAL